MKLTLLRRVVSSVSATFVLMAAMAVPALAQNTQQTANGFRISPVRSEYTIEKGKSETAQLTLENPSDVATTAQAVVNDFVASDKEDGEPRLVLDENAEAPKNSFKSLVQPVADVELGPREKKDITVILKVPSDASAGGYYGAIRFIPSGGSSGSGNVGLTASVGTIMLVTVPGDLNEQLNLVQLSAAQEGTAKSFITSGGLEVLTRLQNTGDIHVKPFGKIQVKNIFGKVVEEHEFNSAGSGADARANVLPGSTRKFINKLEKKYLGRYTIEANIGYSSSGGDIISSKATFWYMPIWAILVAIAVVVLIIAGIYFLIRKLMNRRK